MIPKKLYRNVHIMISVTPEDDRIIRTKGLSPSKIFRNALEKIKQTQLVEKEDPPEVRARKLESALGKALDRIKELEEQ